jgi:hypothetical protein
MLAVLRAWWGLSAIRRAFLRNSAKISQYNADVERYNADVDDLS